MGGAPGAGPPGGAQPGGMDPGGMPGNSHSSLCRSLTNDSVGMPGGLGAGGQMPPGAYSFDSLSSGLDVSVQAWIPLLERWERWLGGGVPTFALSKVIDKLAGMGGLPPGAGMPPGSLLPDLWAFADLTKAERQCHQVSPLTFDVDPSDHFQELHQVNSTWAPRWEHQAPVSQILACIKASLILWPSWRRSRRRCASRWPPQPAFIGIVRRELPAFTSCAFSRSCLPPPPPRWSSSSPLVRKRFRVSDRLLSRCE